ncbi:MAG: patatin-like phospholipase family protein [Pseudomonadota bacterium]
MFRRFRLIAGLASALLTTGCAFYLPDRIHYTWNEKAAVASDTSAKVEFEKPEVVGVALSGGGSRASVFGAAALEVLAEAGVMQQATYLSSVSGGGFAAAYYALKKPTPCAPTDPAQPCSSESFTAFKTAMRHNFLKGMTFRQIGKPGRISSPTRRLSSLQDALDDKIIDGAVFGDLPPSPILLINGARYDDGRRFVFSNVAIPEEESDVQQFSNETLRTATFSQPGCTRPVPSDFSVALAVAISAGFPPLLGPATFEMPGGCASGDPQYWHLGDGGILDNTGVETIEDFALRADTNGVEIERVVIFSIDAGRSTPTTSMMQLRNLKLWTTDPGRVVDIVGKRAQAYREVALNKLRGDADIDFLTIKITYTDAIIDDWPAACGARDGGRAAISEHLRNIPTNLKITDCDAELLEVAARDVANRALNEKRVELEKYGVNLAPLLN